MASLDALLASAAEVVDDHDAHPEPCCGPCVVCGCCAVYAKPGCRCDGAPGETCGCAEVAAETDPENVEAARAIAVRLEQELAGLREALIDLHAPRAVGSSDPEDPTIICQTCREDFPCETRSYLDALDPARAELDEFADTEPPF